MPDHRFAFAGDAADISALIQSFQPDLLIDPAGKDAEAFLAVVSTEAVRFYIASPRYSFIVAHEDGRLIGVVAIQDRTHLFYLFVDRAHQQRGLGRRLWELAKAEAMAGGHAGFFTVSASMKAVPVYQRLGFRRAGPPIEVQGVRCVPMTLGQISRFTLVLPRENCYPEMNEAATDFLQLLSAAFSDTPHGRVQTRIAAAASLAGSLLLREMASDPQRQGVGHPNLADAHRRQFELILFMQATTPSIDPSIDRGTIPDAGLKGNGWYGEVPAEHAPLLDADTMLGRLQGLPEKVTDRHGIPPTLRTHVMGLAAMKLISSAHRSGVLDQRVGKALVRCYLAAGCRTSPVPMHARQGISPAGSRTRFP